MYCDDTYAYNSKRHTAGAQFSYRTVKTTWEKPKANIYY